MKRRRLLPLAAGMTALFLAAGCSHQLTDLGDAVQAGAASAAEAQENVAAASSTEWTMRGRKVNSENPLFLSTFYAPSGDHLYWTNNKSEEFPLNAALIPGDTVKYDGYKLKSEANDTLVGRWNAIPDTLKPYSAIILHANNIHLEDGSSSPAANAADGQKAKAFYEALCEVAEKEHIPLVLMTVTAGNSTAYTATAHMDDAWIKGMLDKYDCILGILSTESFWTQGNAAAKGASMLRIAEEKDRLFIWFDCNSKTAIENYMNNSSLRQEMNDHGEDHFVFLYKNTRGESQQDLTATSYCQGMWLAGFTTARGGLMDNWKRNLISAGSLFEIEGGGGGEQSLIMEPEAAVAQQIADIYAGGGCVYSFEHPSYSCGVSDRNSPLFDHAIVKMLEYAVANPAPTREQVAKETKILIVENIDKKYSGTAAQFYQQLGIYDTDKDNWHTYTSGRFNHVPALPDGLQTHISKVESELDSIGGTHIRVLYDGGNCGHCSGGSGDCGCYEKLDDQSQRKSLYETQYAAEYEGDAYAAKVYDGAGASSSVWTMYNSIVNQGMGTGKSYDEYKALQAKDVAGNTNDVADYVQYAQIPVERATMSGASVSGHALKVTMQPHIQVFVEDATQTTDTIHVLLDNYRVDKNDDIYKGGGAVWGAAAGGWSAGSASGRIKLHNYLENHYMDDPKDGREYDFHWRTTSFEVKCVSAAPTVRIDKARSMEGQYDPAVSVRYNPETKTATFAVVSNGWVTLEISNLQFESSSGGDA